MSDVTLVFIWGIGLGMAMAILLILVVPACAYVSAWIRLKIFQMQVSHVTKRVEKLAKEIEYLGNCKGIRKYYHE